MKLLKIASADCPVCESLAEIDLVVAKENNLEFECIDLDLFAQTQGSVRDYVVSYHVNAEDGMIDIPIYVIVDGDSAKASSIIKDEADLTNLLAAWALYNKSKSAEPME
jgi:Zn ribbon nucleic-acid-binding protein